MRINTLKIVSLLLLLLVASSVLLAQPSQETFDVGDSLRTVQYEKRVLDTVREISSRGTWMSRLMRSIFVLEKQSMETDREVVSNPIRKFLRYDSRKISSIRIIVLDVFGGSVDDLSIRELTWLERVGNTLHINTQKAIIRNQLLFKVGDSLDPLLIAESERILRANNYIYDARIRPFSNPDGSVDLDVIVRDVWTLKAEVAMKDVDQWNISFTEDNLWGWGGRLHSELKFDPGYRDGWNWEGSYKRRNLFRDNITGEIYRKVSLGSTRKGVGFNREFSSPLIRWLYGTNLEWNRHEEVMLMDEEVTQTEELRYNRQDLWLGRTFPIHEDGNEQGIVNYLTAAARIIRTDHTMQSDYDPEGHVQDSYMGIYSLGFLIRSYKKVSYLFRFGVTEDIPVGSKFQFTSGYERGRHYNRNYYALYYQYSYYHDGYGYLSSELSASGFKRTSAWESRRFDVSLTGISRMCYLYDYRIRQYFFLEYTRAENPIYSSQLLKISDKSGIRGLTSDRTGNKRLRLNLETNYQMPFRFLGFHFAVSVFGDFAVLAAKDNSLKSSSVYQGYGIGLRFKNEHLIFRTIELFIGYYPTMDDSEDWNYFSRSSSYYSFNKLGFGRPEVIE